MGSVHSPQASRNDPLPSLQQRNVHEVRALESGVPERRKPQPRFFFRNSNVRCHARSALA